MGSGSSRLAKSANRYNVFDLPPCYTGSAQSPSVSMKMLSFGQLSLSNCLRPLAQTTYGFVATRKWINCWSTMHHWLYACILQENPGLDIALNRTEENNNHWNTYMYIQEVFFSCVHFSAYCTNVDILKSYHCITLSKVMGYALILTISLLK